MSGCGKKFVSSTNKKKLTPVFLWNKKMKLSFNEIFKVCAGLFSIGMIAFVVSQDSDNSTEHKGSNTTIVVIQALMVLLLYTQVNFKQSHIAIIWGVLIFAQVICILVRFRDTEMKAVWAFVGGNLLMALVSIFKLPRKMNIKIDKTKDAPEILKSISEAEREAKQREREAKQRAEELINEQRAKKIEKKRQGILDQIDKLDAEKDKSTIERLTQRLIDLDPKSPQTRSSSPQTSSLSPSSESWVEEIEQQD